jgi:hypothetical protein
VLTSMMNLALPSITPFARGSRQATGEHAREPLQVHRLALSTCSGRQAQHQRAWQLFCRLRAGAGWGPILFAPHEARPGDPGRFVRPGHTGAVCATLGLHPLPPLIPRRTAQALWMSKVRRARFPCFGIPSSVVFPLVACYRGTSPSHTAHRRPF